MFLLLSMRLPVVDKLRLPVTVAVMFVPVMDAVLTVLAVTLPPADMSLVTLTLPKEPRPVVTTLPALILPVKDSDGNVTGCVETILLATTVPTVLIFPPTVKSVPTLSESPTFM